MRNELVEKMMEMVTRQKDDTWNAFKVEERISAICRNNPNEQIQLTKWITLKHIERDLDELIDSYESEQLEDMEKESK